MSKDKEPTFEGLDPSTLFREFAAECAELAQGTPSLEKRTLYLKMASVWHQMALRWERKGRLGEDKELHPRPMGGCTGQGRRTNGTSRVASNHRR